MSRPLRRWRAAVASNGLLSQRPGVLFVRLQGFSVKLQNCDSVFVDIALDMCVVKNCKELEIERLRQS